MQCMGASSPACADLPDSWDFDSGFVGFTGFTISFCRIRHFVVAVEEWRETAPTVTHTLGSNGNSEQQACLKSDVF